MIKLGIVTAAIAVFVTASAAEAARCPSGQIWRVSKKMCQDKAIAVKLGIIKAGKGKAQFVKKRKPGKPRKVSAPKTPPTPAAVTQAPQDKPVAEPTVATKPEIKQDPFQAITAVAPMQGVRPSPESKPLPTQMVKAMYFNTAPGQNPASAHNSAIARRAVLNLLKTRLQIHIERNRNYYIDRASQL